MQKKSGGGLADDDRLEGRHKWPKNIGGAQKEGAGQWSMYHVLVIHKRLRAQSQVRVDEYINGFWIRGLPKERVEPHLPDTISSDHIDGSKSVAEHCRLGEMYYIN